MTFLRFNFRRCIVLAMVAAASLAGDWPDKVSRGAYETLHALLEDRFDRAQIGDPATIIGVIVLGGSDDRLREAARLARLYPHFKVFVSGGGEYEYLAPLVGNDIASERLIYENKSSTTFENAVFSKSALSPKPGERWLLITSGIHIPRAMGAFQRVGFAVEPWPVMDRTNSAWATLKHEWLGLFGYWMQDKSKTLFPQGRTARAQHSPPPPGM